MKTKAIKAWESFQEGHVSPAGVRDEVLVSWRRSQWSGVDPDHPRFDETPAHTETDFARTTLPIMQRIAQPLVGSSTAMTLHDARGVILGRWVTDSALIADLEREQVRVGVRWLEETIGTCGGGTTLEVSVPTTVVGAEHFATRLHPWACSAAPVVHPVTRRVCGFVNVTVRAEDANPYLPLAVQSMVLAVSSAIHDAATSREQRLLDAYLGWRSRTRKPVVAVDGSIVITDEAVPLPGDLWARVVEAGPHTDRIVLDDKTRGRIYPVTAGTIADGVVVVTERIADPDGVVVPVMPVDRLSAIEQAERDVILAALDRHAGNKSRAALDIGLSRRTLYAKLDRFRIRV